MNRFFGWMAAGMLCVVLSGIATAQEPGTTQTATGPQRMQESGHARGLSRTGDAAATHHLRQPSVQSRRKQSHLDGQVVNPVLKDSAEKVVKKIEGVESVNNQIEVLPTSGNDDRIRRQVARAIFNDERLFPYSMGSVPPIHIIVKNGHVTLEGLVNSQTDKDQAGIRANGVPGVFSVENHLQVQKS